MSQNTERQEPEYPRNFLATFRILSPVLQREVVKRLFFSACVAILTIIVLTAEKDWTYAIGFLMALGLAYLGLDIVWKVEKNQIYVIRVVVSKVVKHRRRKGRIQVLLRPMKAKAVNEDDVIETFQYDLPVSTLKRNMISVDTVLDLYVSEKNPETALCYEILGEV